MGVSIVQIRATRRDPEAPSVTRQVVKVGIVRGNGKRALELNSRALAIELESEGWKVEEKVFFPNPLGQLLDSENSAFLIPSL